MYLELKQKSYMTKAKCPEGTLCLSTETICIVTVVIILFLCVYIYFLQHHQNTTQNIMSGEESDQVASPKRMLSARAEVPHHVNSSAPQIASEKTYSPTTVSTHRHTPTAPSVTTNIYQTPEYGYSDTLLRPPLRMPPNTTRVHMMPINVETRGATPEMQQIGILRSKNNDTVLALFGRPTYRGSSKWTYYTATDKFHSIKLPVEKNNRDCTHEYGCDELYEDDEVQVKGYNDAFKISIYQMDTPRYIPYV